MCLFLYAYNQDYNHEEYDKGLGLSSSNVSHKWASSLRDSLYKAFILVGVAKCSVFICVRDGAAFTTTIYGVASYQGFLCQLLGIYAEGPGMGFNATRLPSSILLELSCLRGNVPR